MPHDNPLVQSIGFDLLGPEFGTDVERAIQSALADGAVFPEGADALAIFRGALASTIRDIENHPRGLLFQDFLRRGPYHSPGAIPPNERDQFLTDDETAAAVRFIHAHMINCFKGAIAELLAARACCGLLKQLQHDERASKDARLYVGDAVRARTLWRPGFRKGADLHIIDRSLSGGRAVVQGVGEVKSYQPLESRLERQLDNHLRRARRGIEICGVRYGAPDLHVEAGKGGDAARIAVVPGGWLLSRRFHFEPREGGRMLIVEPTLPPRLEDAIEQTGERDWRITLRWSVEALAAAAYEVTFWYMGKVGEAIYSGNVPKDWSEMTPHEAGRNAAKMMLYAAVIRAREKDREDEMEDTRAVALYNSYGFGYALGMNFRDPKGRREILFPEDLDEITRDGVTVNRCRVDGFDESEVKVS
ncbi:MAG TPA: hypothetical protein VHI13_10385 [Candidatus Kapabacteria bacterium]|nr:hypothetical protein [Candidatus Kapabacteria bacterium]